MHTIPPSIYYRFYRYGTGCRIASSGVLSLPEQTAIGTGVLVREDYRWEIPSPAGDGSPRILIGDRCDCSRFLTIIATGKVELRADVITAPHVYINDSRQAWDNRDSMSMVTIGEGSWIGAHSSILGRVKIGKGCVVGAGSVVMRDVPDYCVVAGNPAEFRRIYEPYSGEWIRIRSEAEALEVLERRNNEPLLSICLPVNNQTEDLQRCLESIYAQTGDDGLIEVCVLDNTGEQETEGAIRRYSNLYRSFRYVRNSDPVERSSANQQAAAMARGKFVMLHEPATSFLDDSLTPLLNVLHTHHECAAILIQPVPVRRPPLTERLEGLSEYVKRTAEQASYPLQIIMNRLDWERTAELAQANSFQDPWLYRQYVLLQANPLFCLCRYTMTEAVGQTRGTE